MAASAFLSVAHATTSNAAHADEDVVRLGHSFELGSGDDMLLAQHRKPVTYRVCLEDAPGVAPLKVRVDGKQIDVKEGTCADVTGTHISLRPSAQLSAARTMVGRFERVKQ